MPEKIRAAGGEIYAITSEPQALASRARDQWSFGFESVGDPHQEIAATIRGRGWLDLIVNTKVEGLRRTTTGWQPQHPKGYFQPGVLALTAAGRVLYRWRGVPTRKNMGGATERPTAEHVLSKVLSGLEAASETGDARLDTDPPLDSRGLPWPIFVAMLVANGCFVRPRGFDQRSSGPTLEQRAARAMLRLLGFVGAWTLALWLLPALPVLVAFAAWGAWITPKVRLLNDEFQNVTASYTSQAL